MITMCLQKIADLILHPVQACPPYTFPSLMVTISSVFYIWQGWHAMTRLTSIALAKKIIASQKFQDSIYNNSY